MGFAVSADRIGIVDAVTYPAKATLLRTMLLKWLMVSWLVADFNFARVLFLIVPPILRSRHHNEQTNNVDQRVCHLLAGFSNKCRLVLPCTGPFNLLCYALASELPTRCPLPLNKPPLHCYPEFRKSILPQSEWSRPRSTHTDAGASTFSVEPPALLARRLL